VRFDPWSVPAAPLPDAARPRCRRGRAVAAVLAAALLAGLGGGFAGARLQADGALGTVDLPQVTDAAGDHRAPGSVAGVAAAVLPGVVTLHVRGQGERMGSPQAPQGRGETGTGFVLDQAGHILTNNHVVAPAGEHGRVRVTFNDGTTVDGEVIGTDSGYDLAVVDVDGVSGLHPLTLGDSDAVRVGDPVIAIGAPFDLDGTVTSGIISARERAITAGGEDGTDVSYVNALQTDAAINPGNSGGPLVDAAGRVIGVNSAIKAAGDSGMPGLGDGTGGSIGLGFAIPVNQAKRVAEELIGDGVADHPVIGVTLDMGYRGDGARVIAGGNGAEPVVPGGPADRAGVQPGDVITAIDGEDVHTGEQLIVAIRSHRPGDELTLTVRGRDGRERTVRLTLGSAT
jgi:putative serine protease PepD